MTYFLGIGGAVVGSIVFFYIFSWIIKDPVRGLYLAFFSTGILETVHLGPLRDKVGLTELAIILTWFALILNKSWKKDRAPLTKLQKFAFFMLSAFVLIQWLSFLVNNATFYDHIVGSLVEVLNYTYGAMIVLTTVLLVNSWKKLMGCVSGWLLGTVVVTLIGIWALTGTGPAWATDEFTGRISSTLKFENQIPAFIIPIFVTAIIMSLSRSTSNLLRKGLIILVMLMSVTMIGTGSRTAFLLLIFAFVSLFILGFIEKSNKDLLKGRLGLVMILSSLGLVGYVIAALSAFDGNYSLGHTPSWQRPVVVIYNTITSEQGTLDNTRTKQADVILNNADESMFIGNGPKLYGAKYHVSEIHNTYAGIYTESGFLGVISFISFLGVSLYTALYVRKREAIPYYKLIITSLSFGFILLLLYGMTMYGLRQRNIWLLSGLLIASHSFLLRRNESI
ncbi:O-antigen ligase family protein [Vibrio sp. F13]|uniref:O-antigen ligase family protein n=1 Tax=Vibrio sp. F13 TaxID=2070777 RepID=UPI0010BDFEE9|nr:O-antigen ligase family protein [Vibrio sp. F13]TKF99455.1 O-antigen ligase family protein [Vibrio sp. F13]